MSRSNLIAIFQCLVLWLSVSVGHAAADSIPAENSQRIALVIGNGAYTGGGVLANPVHDATDMAAKLKQLGFDVILRTDADYLVMRRSLTDFGRLVKEGTVALFFYAGHGIQVRGKNYLLPVDARIQIENDVGTEAIDVDFLLDKLNQARLSMVILDACRNNPFERRFRSGSGAGLAHMAAPTGTLIAYSTAPGKVAADGEGRNGLYTGELLKAMGQPGLQIEDVFKHVRTNVVKLSSDTQTPWEASSLTGSFYFVPGGQQQPHAGMPQNAMDDEDALWARLDDKRPCEYKAYLDRYPQGKHSRLAKLSLAECSSLASAGSAAPIAQASVPAAVAKTVTVMPISRVQGSEEDAWGQAESSNTSNAYLAYLKAFPAGGYIGQAISRLSRLKRDEAKQQLGRVIKDCDICPEMVVIPGGRFEMGSAHGAKPERPVHDVSIDNAYALGRTEVTQAQWRAIMGSNPSRYVDCGDNCPVENVSWDDVQAFLLKLNARTGKQYRLPTESEWEYAARAGTTTHYSWGDDVGSHKANCDGCGSQWDNRSTAPVASFPPNAFGLFDMLGNVSEWVGDCWNEDYEGAPEDGTAWVYEGCSERVMRGGSWGQNPRLMRTAARNWGTSGKRLDTRGFRLARSL